MPPSIERQKVSARGALISTLALPPLFVKSHQVMDGPYALQVEMRFHHLVVLVDE
jgi:hypothetical protein